MLGTYAGSRRDDRAEGPESVPFRPRTVVAMLGTTVEGLTGSVLT